MKKYIQLVYRWTGFIVWVGIICYLLFAGISYLLGNYRDYQQCQRYDNAYFIEYN